MNVSVLGLGIIGSAWAKNLIADGHTVRCWNRTPKDFPNFCASIQEAVSQADVIIVIVADPPAVQSVLKQIQSKLGPGQLVIQSSTISAKWTRLFAEQVRKTGASFLEASFTGSKIAAEQRQTVYYLGGDPEIVEKARPILKPLSKAILHIGPLGSASSLKLAMNLNIAGVAQTLCESLILCRRAGIPDDVYFSALADQRGAFRSRRSQRSQIAPARLQPAIFPQEHGEGSRFGSGNRRRTFAATRTDRTPQKHLRSRISRRLVG